jgi:hypothetical protein
VDGAAVTLSIATEPLSRLLSTEANLEVITSAIRSLIAGGWHVNVVVAGAAEPKPTPVAEESDPRGDDNQEPAGAHSAEDAALALLADELGAQPMPATSRSVPQRGGDQLPSSQSHDPTEHEDAEDDYGADPTFVEGPAPA